MTTTILRAADRIATPWKNGGGITREIAVWPPGAGLDHFDWRISMAEVREPGPFSLFPDVDRCLTVIEGYLRLSFSDETSVALDARSEPWTFPGDRACHGLPIGGPVLDLNVMWRRSLYRSQVRRVTNTSWHPTGSISLLIALAPLTIVDGGASAGTRLGALDAWLGHDPATPIDLAIDGPALGIDILAL